MRFVIPLFEGLTALDAVGPYEVVSRLPGAEVLFAADSRGVYRTDQGSLGLTADVSLDEIDRCDVVIVPGGPGQQTTSRNGDFLVWLREMDRHTAWTTSVCTGSLLLGAAGLLTGKRATTHWLSTDLLADYGATVVAERVVVDGKYATAAGVSAGIDLALWLAGQLAGDVVAQGVQLSIEYDPQPPFNSGNPSTAPADLVDAVRVRARSLRRS